MTIDPGGGAEWMVDLEGWGSDLCVAGSGLDRLGNSENTSAAWGVSSGNCGTEIKILKILTIAAIHASGNEGRIIRGPG